MHVSVVTNLSARILRKTFFGKVPKIEILWHILIFKNNFIIMTRILDCLLYWITRKTYFSQTPEVRINYWEKRGLYENIEYAKEIELIIKHLSLPRWSWKSTTLEFLNVETQKWISNNVLLRMLYNSRSLKKAYVPLSDGSELP